MLRTLSRIGVLLLLYAVTCVPWATAQSDAIVFVGGIVLTQDPQRPVADAVALRGGRIIAVGPAADVRKSAGTGFREIDLRGRTLIPGLIDAHVHLGVPEEEGASVVQAARTTLAPTLSAYLSHGVTTVRTAGGRMPQSAELGDLLDSGEVVGPRLVFMGPPFSAPGGHPGVTVCRNNPRCRAGLREVSDEHRARAYVREPSNRGINTLKVIANFIPDVNIGRELPSIPDPLLAAIADEAHKNGLRVGAHVADTATMIRMIGMGYDQFMHLPDTISAPDDVPILARMLAGKSISVTTTLALRDSYRDASGSERRVFGTPYGDDTRRMFEQMLKTAAAFHAAGVPLVVGTDCCQGAQIGDPRLQPGARALHEMDLLDRAELPREAILAAATRVAANALGLSDTIGTIAPGKAADLVMLAGDPRRDFSALHKPVAVLKAGRLVSGTLPDYAQPNPPKDIERVIREFLIAFGNRDYAAFIPYFTDDATVFFPPSAAAPLGRVRGRSEIERTFKAIFDAYPPRSNRPPAPIAPQALLIQELDGHAVVTFQLGSETARQRRTFVLKRVGAEWKIVHLHGSASANQP